MNIALAATPQVIGDQQYPVGIMQVDGATVSTCICTAGLIHVLERKTRLLFLGALPTETKQARDEIAWLPNVLFSQRISPTVSKRGILDEVTTAKSLPLYMWRDVKSKAVFRINYSKIHFTAQGKRILSTRAFECQ